MVLLKSVSSYFLPGFDLAFHDLVVRRVDVLVQRGRDLLHPERREEPVVDPVLQRVDVHRLAEVLVRVDVVAPLRRRGQAQLHRGREIFEDVAPGAFVVRPAAVALVDDDEVEEVRRVLAEVGARVHLPVCPASAART